MVGDVDSDWAGDVAQSRRAYVEWFSKFAPATHQETLDEAFAQVRAVLSATDNLRSLTPAAFADAAFTLPCLRMCTRPPLAVDRIMALSGVEDRALVGRLERGQSIEGTPDATNAQLAELLAVVKTMLDPVLFPWLVTGAGRTEEGVDVATAVVADRLGRSRADSKIRNEHEKRQRRMISEWLQLRGYSYRRGRTAWQSLHPGEYRFGVKVPGRLKTGGAIAVPVDLLVMPHSNAPNGLPLFIEMKSAGDCTNVNKRRKEEVARAESLTNEHESVVFAVVMGGYFDAGYIRYVRDRGIKCVWDHALDALEGLGL